MNPQDLVRLKDLRFSSEVIDKTEEVLRLWEIENLFTVCSYCDKPCFVPEVANKRQFRRKKLPAELFLRRELISVRDELGDVVCIPCDDFNFEH
jgi:hypothetical protein